MSEAKELMDPIDFHSIFFIFFHTIESVFGYSCSSKYLLCSAEMYGTT